MDDNLPQIPDMPTSDPSEGVPGKRDERREPRIPPISQLIKNIKNEKTQKDLFVRHLARSNESIHGFEQFAEVFTDLFIIAAEQEIAPGSMQRIRLCSDVLKQAMGAYNAFRQNDELPLVKRAFDQLKSDWDLIQMLLAKELTKEQRQRIQEEFDHARVIVD